MCRPAASGPGQSQAPRSLVLYIVLVSRRRHGALCDVLWTGVGCGVVWVVCTAGWGLGEALAFAAVQKVECGDREVLRYLRGTRNHRLHCSPAGRPSGMVSAMRCHCFHVSSEGVQGRYGQGLIRPCAHCCCLGVIKLVCIARCVPPSGVAAPQHMPRTQLKFPSGLRCRPLPPEMNAAADVPRCLVCRSHQAGLLLWGLWCAVSK